MQIELATVIEILMYIIGTRYNHLGMRQSKVLDTMFLKAIRRGVASHPFQMPRQLEDDTRQSPTKLCKKLQKHSMKEDKGKKKERKEGGVRKEMAQPTNQPIYPSPGMTLAYH